MGLYQIQEAEPKMSPDCESPHCHEKMKLDISEKVGWTDFEKVKKCAGEKVPKKAVWVLIPILFLAGGIMVAAADFKYAQKSDVSECQQKQIETQTIVSHMREDLKEIKEAVRDVAKRQQEASESFQRDTKEILRYLRDK